MLTFKTWASVVGASSAILLLSSVCGWIYRRFVKEDASLISSFRTSVQFCRTNNLAKAKTRALTMIAMYVQGPFAISSRYPLATSDSFSPWSHRDRVAESVFRCDKNFAVIGRDAFFSAKYRRVFNVYFAVRFPCVDTGSQTGIKDEDKKSSG
jgi:hypothetical protein